MRKINTTKRGLYITMSLVLVSPLAVTAAGYNPEKSGTAGEMLRLLLPHEVPSQCLGLAVVTSFYVLFAIGFMSLLFFLFAVFFLLGPRPEELQRKRVLEIMVVGAINFFAAGILIYLLQSCCR